MMAVQEGAARTPQGKVSPGMAVGTRYGRLVVCGETMVPPGEKRLRVRTVCDCGNTATPVCSKLRSGVVRSCGCIRRRRYDRPNGDAFRRVESIRYDMIRRCNDPASRSYPNYGGRGIRVCDQWRGTSGREQFALDMGIPPTPQHSIDRIDNDGNYEPSNCRWASPITQHRNTRCNRMIAALGTSLTLAEWAERTGLHKATIRYRLDKLKWPPDKALSTPPDRSRSRGRRRAILSALPPVKP